MLEFESLEMRFDAETRRKTRRAHFVDGGGASTLRRESQNPRARSQRRFTRIGSEGYTGVEG